MKITKDEMRKLKIFNGHEYAMGRPYIYYQTQETGRVYRSAAWVVYDSHRTIPGPWYEYGRKTFACLFNPVKVRPEKFLECVKYFKETYNIAEVARTPFGDWMDAEFVKARNEEIKKALKSLIPDYGDEK